MSAVASGERFCAGARRRDGVGWAGGTGRNRSELVRGVVPPVVRGTSCLHARRRPNASDLPEWQLPAWASKTRMPDWVLVEARTRAHEKGDATASRESRFTGRKFPVPRRSCTRARATTEDTHAMAGKDPGPLQCWKFSTLCRTAHAQAIAYSCAVSRRAASHPRIPSSRTQNHRSGAAARACAATRACTARAAWGRRSAFLAGGCGARRNTIPMGKAVGEFVRSGRVHDAAGEKVPRTQRRKAAWWAHGCGGGQSAQT